MIENKKIRELENKIKTSFKEYTDLIVSDTKSLGFREDSQVFGMLIRKGLVDYKKDLRQNLTGIANGLGLSKFEFENLMEKVYEQHLNIL